MTSSPEPATSLPSTTKEPGTEIPHHNLPTTVVHVTEAPEPTVFTNPPAAEIATTEIPTTEVPATEAIAPLVTSEIQSFEVPQSTTESLEMFTLISGREEPVTETSFTVSFRETSPEIQSESISMSFPVSETQKPLDQIVPLKDPEQHLFTNSEKEAKSLSAAFQNLSSTSQASETPTTIPLEDSDIITTTEIPQESSTDFALKMSVSFETSENSQSDRNANSKGSKGSTLAAAPEFITMQDTLSLMDTQKSVDEGNLNKSVSVSQVTSKVQKTTAAVPNHQSKARKNADVNVPVVEFHDSQGVPVIESEALHQQKEENKTTSKIVVSVTEERRSDSSFPSPKTDHTRFSFSDESEAIIQSPSKVTGELSVMEKKIEQKLKKVPLRFTRKRTIYS